MVAFRFAATKVLLTYSQVCNEFTAETILYDFQERFRLDTWVIGEETHQDGGRHYHACLTFKSKLDTRDQTIFDIACANHQHHPNIKNIQRGQAHLNRARDYCKKEDPAPLTNVQELLTWGEIIAQSNTGEEYLQKVRENYPREYCQHLRNYEYSASKLFPLTTINTLTEFRWDQEEPQAWNMIDNRTQNWDQAAQTLVLIGPAGCGKTTWAKLHAPKPALWVTHLDTLTQINATHRSIIFDDLDFAHLPASTQKYLVDIRDQRQIHCRYRTATVPAGIPRIVTANNWPFGVTNNDVEAINRRIKLIDLY